MRLSPRQREALRLIAEGSFFPVLTREDDGWHARWRALGSENAWVDEFVREAVVTALSEDAEEQRHETLHDAWMMALRSRTGLVVWDDAECAAFSEELESWSGSAEEDVAARSGIVFRFKPFEIRCAIPRARRALKALGSAVYVFAPLGGLRRSGDELALQLTAAEAESFVHAGARDLRHAGYGVEGVDLSVAITAEAEVDFPEAGSRTARMKLTVRVAGEPVTAEEIRFLLDQGSSLVFFRSRWIEVDRGVLKAALRALEKGAGKKANALSFALGLGHVGGLELESVRVRGWVRGLLNSMRAAGSGNPLEEACSIAGFRGELRPYQRRGVAWMRFLVDHGFGALLADDMGLGKTIQTIAWAWTNRELTLIVAPLTLLANWEHEFKRFAPSLKVYVHQGEGRRSASEFRRSVARADVVLTSYTLLVKDYADFSEVSWKALVLDEAQAIKNPETQAARAVRSLLPPKRIALTGTPIENSVADLWSIEEFLNPGFLGDRKSFEARFAKPIALDERSSARARLKRALEPLVLRRLKTDPGVAAEIGEKRETREYCRLTDEERRDYESALADFRVSERARGDVLALITRLKLICDGAGKFERLAELLAQILENGESALVFTQYAKVGAWLQRRLAERFGRTFPFLHGSLSAAQRSAEIAKFNRSGANAFILSLKAGGFGLNLTKATHVIHFDRWWNPAVEDQATDRAHRIGQSRAVLVHLFVTVGTLEERVDEILARKGSLRALIADGEAFYAAAALDGEA